jgi:hypothetical protein
MYGLKPCLDIMRFFEHILGSQVGGVRLETLFYFVALNYVNS